MNTQPINSPQPRTPGSVMAALWRNWVVSYGALTLPVLLVFFLPKVTVPFVLLIEAYLMTAYSHARGRGILGTCSHILIMTSRILAISGLLMVAILILYTDRVIPTVFRIDTYNVDIPFIVCLVITPVTTLVCTSFLLFGKHNKRCKQCRERHSAFAPDTAIVQIYFRESRYQIQVLLAIAICLGGLEYWYYFARYINVNMNPQDIFIFNILPILAYILSVFFLGGRYATIDHLYDSVQSEQPVPGRATRVRFLVFSGDELMVTLRKNGKWDTPFRETLSFTSTLGDHRAKVLFSDASGVAKPMVRYLFTNVTFATDNNVIHYAAFLTDEQREAMDTESMWFNAYMIDQALATRMMEPMLAQELYRIHTITMAWKTYDREGRRLYPIRNYRPTFRLRDLPEWNVDYDDDHWLDIARNNQDRSFFRLRNAWLKMTSIFARTSR